MSFELNNYSSESEIETSEENKIPHNTSVESHLLRLKHLNVIHPESKILKDYINKYAILQKIIESTLHNHHNSPEDIQDDLAILNTVAKKGVLKYEEWFPKEAYGEVVNDDNKEMVEYINEAVDLINSLVKKEWTLESFENNREDLVRAMNIMEELTDAIGHELPAKAA
jgi:hypothetical protein